MKNISILLVEDNKSNKDVFVALLESYGLEIDTVSNGFEAIEAVKKKKYDIIFMDIQLPLMNGFDATKEIRKLPQMQNVPIIAVTAHTRESDQKKSLESGMTAHLSKPLDPKLLFGIIDEYLK
jgi:CheY-like chemotaxis protein